MAGYLFLISKKIPVAPTIESGVYSTNISEPTNYWRPQFESTFADYVTMKEGDYVFFFQDRLIYGMGRLKNVGPDCKYRNYPDANKPIPFQYNDVKSKLLVDVGESSVNQRWMCTFEPYPYFFKQGIDMDDLLSSDPDAFKALRVMSGVSFTKMDDKETQAMIDAVLLLNLSVLKDPEKMNVHHSNAAAAHAQIEQKIINDDYTIDPSSIIEVCFKNGVVTHEKALEAQVLWQLAEHEEGTIEAFGEWDFLTHQVSASPFKPVSYIDRMDIFGYSFIEGVPIAHRHIIEQYLIIELKNEPSSHYDVEQLLKYVDWVKDDYAHGNYGMIRAFLVAPEFTVEAISRASESDLRKYTLNRRPARSQDWSELELVTYNYDTSTRKLVFQKVELNRKSPSSIDP